MIFFLLIFHLKIIALNRLLTFSASISARAFRKRILLSHLTSMQESNLLHCQQDSYRVESLSKVLRCDAKSDGIFSVILDNSVLYAEGGGQPCDLGTINGVPVLKVIKPEKEYSIEDFDFKVSPVNLSTLVEVETSQAFPPNEFVRCQVDWKRRYDFMQQHSAQHLFSAIADKLFGAETVGWSLGADAVTVDLKLYPMLTPDQLNEIESETNKMIRENRKVSYRVYPREELDRQLQAERKSEEFSCFRGEVKGAALQMSELRLISIEGLDLNPCGGTHVSALSEISVFKILGTERDTANSIVKVKFVAGERALSYFHQCVQRESAISQLISSKPCDFVPSIEKFLKERKDLTKRFDLYNDELAYYYGKDLAAKALQKFSEATDKQPVVIVEHRYGADLKFLIRAGNTMVDHCELPFKFVLFISGDENIPLTLNTSSGSKGGKKDGKKTASEGKEKASPLVQGKTLTEGPFILFGDVDLVNSIKERVLELLGGRGGGRPGRLQGYSTNLANVPQICNAISDILLK